MRNIIRILFKKKLDNIILTGYIIYIIKGATMIAIIMTLLIGCGEKETDSSEDTSIEESG